MYLLYVYFICCNPLFGFSQDVIKLRTGQEMQVRILDKSGKILYYRMMDEDSQTVHKVSRNFIKWHRNAYLTKTRIAFSFSFGAIPYGTASGIKKYMRDHGYTGSVSRWFGSSIEYPVSRVMIPVLFELEYLIKPPHGISVEFAASNYGSVEGYHQYGFIYGREVPYIRYKNPQFTLSYKLYSRSFKSALQAGLILNFSTIIPASSNSGSNEEDVSQIKPGILVGYTGSIIEQKGFFMRFQSQFRYVLPITYNGQDLFMHGEKIALSQFFIGIQTGFKLYPIKF